MVPNLIAHCYRCSEPILREEFLITLKRVEAGDTKPIVPDLFYKELHGNFFGGAVSENKGYQEVGIHVANILDKHRPLSYYDKLHLACCYKGVGEIEKALDFLEQVDGANSPGMKKTFLENSCKAFRKKFVEELAKKQTSKQEQAKKQPVRSISSVVEVPKDRIIHAITQDGDTLWICANMRQDPNAPSDIYDPVIYRYRIATDERTSLKLPERIKGMATSIIARNKTIWVGTDEGLLEIEPDRNIFRHLKEDDGLLKPNVNSLTLSNNKLYIGLGSGAGYLDINKHHFTGLITTNDVVRIASSPKAIWVITKGNGLICFSEKSDEKEFQSVWNCADSFSLAANHRYVVIGKNLQVGRYFGMRNVGAGGLLVYDLKLNRKYSISGLEHFRSADVLSLAFAGDLLWVGGRGF